MPVIEQGGVKLFYEVAGGGSESVPLILTHGMAATSSLWRPNLAALSRDRTVITWDMRGHGRSDSPPDEAQYSEALTVSDIGALLDVNGVQRAIVGGLSLGGYMSLAFHLRYPQRVAALMLFDTGPGYKRDEPRERWNATADTIAVRYEENGSGALPDSAGMDPTAHRGGAGLARAARGMLKQFDASVIESLPTIAAPTLVLVGADDLDYLPAADYMAAKIPHGTKVVIDGAGHTPNVDQPEAFNRAALAFLDRV
jgi:pimeloyl-ACP methyl ester carboxylesterase